MKTEFKKWFKTGKQTIDAILTQAEPFLDQLIQKYHKSREAEIKLWNESSEEERKKLKMTFEPKPITEREEEHIRMALTYDLSKSLTKNIKEDDEVTNITFNTSKGIVKLNASVEREGNKYHYETEMIYAGGYNIQQLHYRYITKTNLPKNTDLSILELIKREMSKMKTQDRIQAEIEYLSKSKARWESELAEKVTITREQADLKYFDFYYERFNTGPKFEYLNDQAKTVYGSAEAYDAENAKRSEENWNNIQHQIKKYIPYHIKDLEKKINKQREKLTKIEEQ